LPKPPFVPLIFVSLDCDCILLEAEILSIVLSRVSLPNVTVLEAYADVRFVGTKGVSQFYHLSFDDNKVLKLSIGYAKSLFKFT